MSTKTEQVFLLLLILLVVCAASSGVFIPESTYHDYDELELFLKNIHTTFPKITNLYSIGKSVQGRQLFVMSLGKYPQDDKLLQPKVKYVGSMHGNEAVGKEVLLNLIKYLAVSYETNSTVRQFLDTTQVHILPSMNPDGFETAKARTGERTCSGIIGRYNARNVDLNRNFPDYFVNNNVPRAQETKAVMNWLAKTQFVLSANLHGGAMVANYPFDNYHDVNPHNPQAKYSRAPDDDVFIHLAKSYSFNHATMHSGPACDLSGGFTDGITNGAEWYPATGVMQDYNYLYAGCMELTIELSCCKYPASSELAKYWSDNKDALFSYLNQVHIGILGIVMDEDDNPLAGANITVAGREQFVVRSTVRGEYWRLLLPGSYTLKVSCPGYMLEEVDVVVPTDPGRKLQNITLTKDYIRTASCAPVITSHLIPSLFGLWYLVWQLVCH